MFDHVKFGVSDYATSKAFFLKALEPLGVAVVAEGEPTYGVELGQPEGKVSLCLYQTAEKTAQLHLAFVAANREQVEAFHRAALEAGGSQSAGSGGNVEAVWWPIRRIRWPHGTGLGWQPVDRREWRLGRLRRLRGRWG
jgi:catechol 2,3-dioxygenase-like lactoylglutathione lyase family enzyme